MRKLSFLKESKINDKKQVELSKYISKHFSQAKRQLLIRTYWRGNTYKRILHVSILVITIAFVLSGISSRVAEISTSRVLIADDYGLGANVDSLQQGVGIELSKNYNPLGFEINNYTVADGDTLDSIAEKFSVTSDTVQWANSSKINYFDRKVKVGDQLIIPQISGVLYEVKQGDTLDSVLTKTSGNRFEVIEINQLSGPDFILRVGSQILIPNGKLPPPPPPPPLIPYQNQYRYPTNVGINIASNLNYTKLNDISFVNPLSNPDCAGYGWSRGYLPWHNGIDLPKSGGCPVRAAASGTVIRSGWSNYGEGYYIRIDHGNGVQTDYYHAETLWVRVGDYVAAGQEIMYMGCQGTCTGTHLHLGLRLDGIFIDPAPYIPY